MTESLRRLADFLLLRPFFTLWSLRVFWWMYIFVELDRLYRQINQVFHHAEFVPITSTIWNWVNLIHAPIYYFVEITTARLLLDLVVPLIWPALQAQDRPNRHSVLQEIIAFLDFAPFFTPQGLRWFWAFFLLQMLPVLYRSVAWNYPDPRFDGQIGLWFDFLIVLLGPLSYVAGVRLLIEAALLSRSGGFSAHSDVTPNPLARQVERLPGRSP
jgi:hypothetical protein